MRNHVSETAKASSQSGTSAKTVATVKTDGQRVYNSKFAFILDYINSRTSQETIQDLIRIGVYNEAGELMPHYKRGTRKSVSKTRKATSLPVASPKTPPVVVRSERNVRAEMAEMLEDLKKKTPEEIFQAFVRIGVYNDAGELMPHYKPKPKKS